MSKDESLRTKYTYIKANEKDPMSKPVDFIFLSIFCPSSKENVGQPLFGRDKVQCKGAESFPVNKCSVHEKGVVRNPLRFCQAKNLARRLDTIPVERLKSCWDETHSGSILFACVDDSYLLLHFDRICSECSGRSIWFSELD